MFRIGLHTRIIPYVNTVPAASKLGSFVWGIADPLRGPYKPHQYGGAILPMTTLRRLECEIVPPRLPGVVRCRS
jgi:hypothetical protein